MTVNLTARQLTAFACLRNPDDYPAGTCVAWMEAAERVCSKHTDDYLCTRHLKTAQARAEKAVAKERADREKAKAKAAKERPKLEAELTRVEKRLDALDPLRRTDWRGDPAEVNLPLRQRIPSDTRIHQLATLHQRRERLRQRLGVAS